MLGLSRQSISKLEKGLSKLTVSQYIAIRYLLDAWIVRHPENKSLPRVISLLLDNLEMENNEYLHLRRVTETVAAAASMGLDQSMIDDLSRMLLDEWEQQAKHKQSLKNRQLEAVRKGYWLSKSAEDRSIPLYLAAFQNGGYISEEEAAEWIQRIISSAEESLP